MECLSAWEACGSGRLSPLAESRMRSTQYVGADKFPGIKQGGVVWFKLII